MPQSAPVPPLLVEFPSWPRVFFGNLRDLIFPHRLPPLELRSAPAPFWHDVLVERRLPWGSFLQSIVCHALAGVLLVVFTRLFAMQPQIIAQPTFDHTQVIYYEPSEYLPPLDTRSPQADPPKLADPEFARQPIISVPPEADNNSQTIVAPPNVKLKHDVALPNIVAWSDKQQKPQLDIPPVPLTPAAEITRIAPRIENAVVAPVPDAAHLTNRRENPTLQTSVVAPPPDLTAQRTPQGFNAPEPSIIAPPPSAETAARLGDINIGRSSVIAPAPQLAVSEQRALTGGRSAPVAGSSQVVAPPPSLAASGPSSGSPGRVIALNLHPAVGAPPDPPAGNRRGTFAATPEGHAGASGTPGSTAGAATGTDSHSNGSSKEAGTGSSRKGSGDLPSGLYVGSTAAKPSPVAGDPAAKASSNSVNPNLMASVRPPSVTSPRPMQPGDAAKLSEAERAVFGNRRFYSLTLNMPNLNSAGGSWVIRFAEIKHEANAPAADISQPTATRKVDPAYPLQLMRENVSGTVILYAVIHADGSVGNVRVLRGVDDRLDQFASQALTQWQFQPATKNGTPVDVEATFQIPFRPSRQQF
jgi:TonB family protein